MVRARGVEPPTTWFVARCSIQLSYARRRVRITESKRQVLGIYLPKLPTRGANRSESQPILRQVYGYSHHPQQHQHRPGFREDVCDDRYAGHAGDITDDVVQLPGSSVPKRFGCDGRDSKPSRLSYQRNTHAKILGERRADRTPRGLAA